MVGFILRRLAGLIPVMVLVLIIVFSLVRLIPGDPAVTLLGPGATEAQIAALRAQLGLDQSVVLQFFHYTLGLVTGNFGTSLKSGNAVGAEILQRLPATLELSCLAVIGAVNQPPLAEWGADVAASLQYARSAAWVALAPGMAILLAVLSFNLIGDSLADWLNPRRRKEFH